MTRLLPEAASAWSALYVLLETLTDLKQLDDERYLALMRVETALFALGLHATGFDDVQAAILGELRQYEHLLPDGILGRCFALDQASADRTRVKEIRKRPYAEYLQSDGWARTRQRAIDRAGSRCQLCNAEPTPRHPLEVHHRTYDRLGAELPGDLTVLCGECHRRFHDRLPQAEPELERWQKKPSGEGADES